MIGLLGAVLATAVFVHLVAAYWAFWDLGVNAVANAGTLLVLYAPVVFAILLAAGALGAWGARRHSATTRAWLVTLVSQALVVSVLFFAEAYRSSDQKIGYADMRRFVGGYVTQLLEGRLAPDRRWRN